MTSKELLYLVCDLIDDDVNSEKIIQDVAKKYKSKTILKALKKSAKLTLKASRELWDIRKYVVGDRFKDLDYCSVCQEIDVYGKANYLLKHAYITKTTKAIDKYQEELKMNMFVLELNSGRRIVYNTKRDINSLLRAVEGENKYIAIREGFFVATQNICSIEFKGAKK